jgi:hypothetical protein
MAISEKATDFDSVQAILRRQKRRAYNLAFTAKHGVNQANLTKVIVHVVRFGKIFETHEKDIFMQRSFH